MIDWYIYCIRGSVLFRISALTRNIHGRDLD